MPAKVYVLPIWQKQFKESKGVAIVNTTSRGKTLFERSFSPFTLGPVRLYKDYHSWTMENAWQYSKVYKEHLKPVSKICHEKLLPLDKSYWKWAKAGWNNMEAVRYPMGKGRKPEFSLWEGSRLGYVAARRRIYCPLYTRCVLGQSSYHRLLELYRTKKELVLLDFDAYDHWEAKMTLSDVLNNPDKKMGHAFVLAMLLTHDVACGQFLMDTLP